jgi:4-amino-4-deoxy-L-arabinose transferase-like glycosyltransferase
MWMIVGAAIVVRFIGLETSPPGFSMDEAMGAANLACLGETGYSAEGVRWPLFATGDGGGYYTPVYLYFGAAWTRLFGISIAAIRAIPAFFCSFAVLGVYCLTRKLAGPRAALWATFVASLSPWGMHFSRVAWDPPVAAAFVPWLCYFWLLGKPLLGGLLSGAAFAGAIYSYPPTRIQAPMLFAILFLMMLPRTRKRLVRSIGFAISSVLLSIPLILRVLNPEFLSRSNGLAIFTDSYLKGNRGIFGPKLYLLRTLLDNVAQHFRPSFLFLTGDVNYRHSSQTFGVLSLVDDVALLLGLVIVIQSLRRRLPDAWVMPGDKSLSRTFVLGISGWVLGVLPAALTWDGVPHALRGIGAWPFVALVTGAILAQADRYWRNLKTLAGLVGALHWVLYGAAYYRDFPKFAGEFFDVSWNDSMIHYWEQTPEKRRANARDAALAQRYFLMSQGAHNCEQSERTRASWAK